LDSCFPNINAINAVNLINFVQTAITIMAILAGAVILFCTGWQAEYWW
jgi:hypothetical protein